MSCCTNISVANTWCRNLLWLLLMLFVFISNNSTAQKLSAYFNHDRVKMGEPVELILRVELQKSARISLEPYEKEIPAVVQKEASQINQKRVALELVDEFRDSSKQVVSTITWEGRYTLIAWDTGKVILPEHKIAIDDSIYLFNEVLLYVSATTIGMRDELFDIEEGFADIPDKPTFLEWMRTYWYFFAGAVLLIGALTYYLIKKKKRKTTSQQHMMSLKDRTLFAINALDQRKVWKEGHYKQHYTELSHIMRSYLSSRYNLNLLERTTLETRLLLQEVGLQAATVDTLMTLLKQADMVKFANSTTDELTIMKLTAMAKQIVVETSPLEFEA